MAGNAGMHLKSGVNSIKLKILQNYRKNAVSVISLTFGDRKNMLQMHEPIIINLQKYFVSF